MLMVALICNFLVHCYDMAATKTKKAIDHIVPLNMNGLRGRMLHLAAPKSKKRELLFIYGHHASLERYVGFAEALNKYGSVTMPDLPGFGGMDAFYKIGMVPTLDNLADYLASFIRLRFGRRRITVVGMSFGFIVVAKMLQKYPDIAKRVDLVVSVVGFVHKDDFRIKRRNYYLMRAGTFICTNRLIAWSIRTLLFQPTLIRLTYKLVENRNEKLKDATPEIRAERINFEIGLWRSNEVRTYMKTAHEMFTLDLGNKQVDLPVYHISVDGDRYFDNYLVEQHLAVIFNKVTLIKSDMGGHSHTVIATAKEVAPFFPRKIRQLLAKT
ncbi:MAG: hypothetical protein JWS12_770 [Candidatus Saccharibacteria bacterium]|nr:hypothetical protein [Candidatus Saccharibacteria bacterium]